MNLIPVKTKESAWKIPLKTKAWTRLVNQTCPTHVFVLLDLPGKTAKQVFYFTLFFDYCNF